MVLTEKTTERRQLVLPKPTNFALLENPQQKRLPSTDSAGYAVFQGAFKAGYDWQMQCGFANLQPEILALRLARKFNVTTNQVVTVARTIYVDTNTIAGAPNADVVGHGVTADVAAANASYKKGHVSTQLTRVPYATIDPVDDTESFAIGDNAALKFSDDLVGKMVTVSYPYTVPSGLTLSADVLPKYEMDITLVTTDNEVALVHVYEAQVNVEGAGFVPGGDAIDVPFFVNPVPGKKLPYDFTYTGKGVLVL